MSSSLATALAETELPASTSLQAIDLTTSGSDRQFVESLRHIGFAVLKNHPLDMDLVNAIYGEWAEFFASDEKYHYRLNRETQDGYFSTRDAESAKGQVKQDFKEYFHFYHFGQCPPSLRGNLERYYDMAHELAATLLNWVEAFSPTAVADHYSEPLSRMIEGSDVTLLRVLHYPPVTGDQEVLRAAAHEDINLLTILPASDSPGLQVQAQDGTWLDVTTDAEQVIVNIGDMLQEASNGWFPSTSHRVITPCGVDRDRSRMSLPLFLHPRPEVQLSARHTARSYLQERLRELGVL